MMTEAMVAMLVALQAAPGVVQDVVPIAVVLGAFECIKVVGGRITAAQQPQNTELKELLGHAQRQTALLEELVNVQRARRAQEV